MRIYFVKIVFAMIIGFLCSACYQSSEPRQYIESFAECYGTSESFDLGNDCYITNETYDLWKEATELMCELENAEGSLECTSFHSIDEFILKFNRENQYALISINAPLLTVDELKCNLYTQNNDLLREIIDDMSGNIDSEVTRDYLGLLQGLHMLIHDERVCNKFTLDLFTGNCYLMPCPDHYHAIRIYWEFGMIDENSSYGYSLRVRN